MKDFERSISGEYQVFYDGEHMYWGITLNHCEKIRTFRVNNHSPAWTIEIRPDIPPYELPF